MTRLSIDDNIDRALEGFTWTHVSDWSPHSVTIQAASQAPGAENICVHMRPCMLVWNGANVCPLACTTRHQNESCLHTTLYTSYTSGGTSYESAAALSVPYLHTRVNMLCFVLVCTCKDAWQGAWVTVRICMLRCALFVAL